GGPGSPAFLFVSPTLQTGLTQPIWGWFGQQDQFAMGPDYDPVDDIGRFKTGSPPVLGLAACAAGIRTVTEIGIDVLRQRSIALTARLIAEADAHLTPLGFELGSPRDAVGRGGHVLLHHPDAYRISVAMRRFAKVVGDFRQPDGLRLAPVAAYVTEAQVVEAIRRIALVVETRRHESLEPAGARVP
ncbi:MAG: kynureninase, partial [Acidobacteriota bacterium]|nr:kynureninase [Acidobacteriota bacterium]